VALAAVIAGTVVALIVIVVVSARLTDTVFQRSSGYARLVDSFPWHGEPPAGLVGRQTVQFGQVRYGGVVTAAVLDQGLYLHVRSRLVARHRPLLLPWEEVSASFPAHLRGKKAVRLDVGRPPFASLTVQERLYADLRSRLVAATPIV